MKAKNSKKFYLCLLLLLPFVLPACESVENHPSVAPKPRLILQITVDQLRGDMPMRYMDRLSSGGFRYLMEYGTHYTQAHFQHADTETPVGHASLFTGTTPAHHGIVAGNWLNRQTGEIVYNIEDDRYPIIGQEPKKGTGRSPRSLLSSTIGDEMVISNSRRSRVFSVSVKDRGAILPGGHSGKAFWFSKRDGSFESSTYYYSEYPDWVKAWNAQELADTYKGSQWELLNDISTYVHGDMDDRPYELDYFGLGTIFPHPFEGSSPYFYSALTFTPIGDVLVADFAKAIIDNENLGTDEFTDLLAISFSATDYIGHVYGPSSLEAEDNILRMDRLLNDLFRFVDDRVGLENTLIVLAADHGMCEAPEYMQSFGWDAGRLTSATIPKGSVRQAVRKRLGIQNEVILLYEHPYVYLNEEEIHKTSYRVDEVERIVAEEIIKIPGFHAAVTRSDMENGTLAPTSLNRKILNNFHPHRSGNIHVVAEQFWYFAYEMDDVTQIAAIHGSPWSYDTFVPLFFAGHGIPAQTVSRAVTPYDIAPTLAAYLNIKPPSGSIGNPLVEVLTK
jgi:predicted AlkP superfamily pyrophosphatase or phosphodiesterase